MKSIERVLKEFERLDFGDCDCYFCCEGHFDSEYVQDGLKAFLRKALEDQREEIKEELGIINTHTNYHVDGQPISPIWNSANVNWHKKLRDFISTL